MVLQLCVCVCVCVQMVAIAVGHLWKACQPLQPPRDAEATVATSDVAVTVEHELARAAAPNRDGMLDDISTSAVTPASAAPVAACGSSGCVPPAVTSDALQPTDCRSIVYTKIPVNLNRDLKLDTTVRAGHGMPPSGDAALRVAESWLLPLQAARASLAEVSELVTVTC